MYKFINMKIWFFTLLYTEPSMLNLTGLFFISDQTSFSVNTPIISSSCSQAN